MINNAACSAGWTYFPQSGLCYKYHSIEKTWDEARRFCQTNAQDGDLASVPDKATNDFLTTLTTEYSWIGATDEGSEGTWRWSDGTPWGYENWSPNNPDNWGNMQHYAAINWKSVGLWDDNSGSTSGTHFICQGMIAICRM